MSHSLPVFYHHRGDKSVQFTTGISFNELINRFTTHTHVMCPRTFQAKSETSLWAGWIWVYHQIQLEAFLATDTILETVHLIFCTSSAHLRVVAWLESRCTTEIIPKMSRKLTLTQQMKLLVVGQILASWPEDWTLRLANARKLQSETFQAENALEWAKLPNKHQESPKGKGLTYWSWWWRCNFEVPVLQLQPVVEEMLPNCRKTSLNQIILGESFHAASHCRSSVKFIVY